MKQVAQNYRSGELTVLDVPKPSCAPGGVLVGSLFSLISPGTEMMKVSESRLSLIGMARARPDQLKKVMDTAMQQGVTNAYRKSMNKLDSYTPLGYSLAGVVLEVGRGAEEFAVGQLVACAGNEFALHADVNWVPVNLCVRLPDGVDPEMGAFATVGAIALQGVRQAEPQLGETACVIGLGLIGQLVVRLLIASGVRVVGIDTVPGRCRLAESAGAILCAGPDDDGVASVEGALRAASGGLGADRVFLAAGGSSNSPVEVAARLARDRATIVDIGKCSLDLPWNAYYEKELQLRFSRSYGPGRYDPRYELEGVDYPAGYVRWTERRNMACILDLVSTGELDLAPLVSAVYPVDEAGAVYEQMMTGALDGIGYLFAYPETPTEDPVRMPASGAGADGPRLRSVADRPQPDSGRPQTDPGSRTRLGFIGAGSYASSMLLPHLVRAEDVALAHVVTERSLSAANAQRKFGFEQAGTDVDAVLGDESIEAVFIVTRHSSHADLTCRALEAGKAVFVEKPLCLTEDELDRILLTVAETGNDRLMVGFNRRFAPILTEMRQRFGPLRGPTVARYLVNAGSLGPSSWYSRKEREGSRFVGEGGHFIDTMSWWIGEDPVEVSARSSGAADDVEVTLAYEGGSVATVTYVTTGHGRFPKETFDVSNGGRSARLDNFRRASVWTGRRPRTRWVFGGADKGQKAELEAFVSAVRSGGPMPVGVASSAKTTQATLAAATSLSSGRPERL